MIKKEVIAKNIIRAFIPIWIVLILSNVLLLESTQNKDQSGTELAGKKDSVFLADVDDTAALGFLWEEDKEEEDVEESADDEESKPFSDDIIGYSNIANLSRLLTESNNQECKNYGILFTKIPLYIQFQSLKLNLIS